MLLSSKCILLVESQKKEEKAALEAFFSNSRKIRALTITDYQGNVKNLLKLPLEEMEEIRISTYGRSGDRDLTKAIDKSKKLRCFSCDGVVRNMVVALATSCTNLTELSLDSDNLNIAKPDDLFSQLFNNNEQLKTLELHRFKSLTGECFLSLNKNTVEEITLSDAPNLKRDYLIKSFPSLVKLRTLKFINFFDNLNYDFIAESISSCGKLNNVTLDRMRYYSAENLLKSVDELKSLEMLRVAWMERGIVGKKFLDYISCNLLELKYLDLSTNNFVSDEDAKLLSQLAKLEVLKIYNLSHITCSGLCDFPNLKEMHCYFCSNLGNDFLIRLLRCADKLKYLDIRGCGKITNPVLDVAIEQTKKRTNNILLEIHIFTLGKNLDMEKIIDKSPLLHLIYNR